MVAYKPGDKRIKEKWVKDQVKKILAGYSHILVDMPASNMYGNNGRHDFVICQNGRFWTIETKAGRGKPTANQLLFAERVADAGGFSLLVNEFNLADVSEAADWVLFASQAIAVPTPSKFLEMTHVGA